MDKRIIWFALIIFLIVGGIFFFRYSKKAKTEVLVPNFKVENSTLIVGDSIYYEDNTKGATSWFWDFGDGTTSKQQKGYNVYYEANQYNIKLTVNGLITDSTYFVTVNTSPDDLIGDRVIVSGPKIVYVGKPVTFTDNTPGAEHTNWQNLITGEIKRDSKTYTTTFSNTGNFTVIATNELAKGSNGQGIIKGKVVNKKEDNDDIVINKKKENPPPPPTDYKQNPSNEQLKTWLNAIVNSEKEFSDNYKPIKKAIKKEDSIMERDKKIDIEKIPVKVKGNVLDEQMRLYGFCQYLNSFKLQNDRSKQQVQVQDVKADWDAKDGFKNITVTVNKN